MDVAARLKIVALSLVGLLTTAAVQAQDLPSLQADRPGYMSGPNTVGARRLQIELGSEYFTYPVVGNPVAGFAPDVLVRWSTGNRWELRSHWTLNQIWEIGGTGDPVNSLLAGNVGFRYHWLQEKSVNVSNQVGIWIPLTGGIASYRISTMANVTPLPWLAVGTTLGYAQGLTLSEPGGWDVVLNLAAAATGRLGFFVERYNLFGPALVNGWTRAYWQGGATYRLENRWQVDGYVRLTSFNEVAAGGGLVYSLPY